MAPFALTAATRTRLAAVSVVAAAAVSMLCSPAVNAAAHSTSAPARSAERQVSHLVKTARYTPTPRLVTPAPAKPVVVASPAPAVPVAPAPRNLLVSADGTLHTGVTVYSDCSGATPLTRTAAAIDTCVGGRIFFVGHNPGVFTPLMHMGDGALLTWYDSHGTAHPMRIVAVRVWQHVGLPPAPLYGAPYQFQTCITLDGSVDRLIDAVPA